jgi:hypothetical protein
MWSIIVTVIRYSPTQQICRASFYKNQALTDTSVLAPNFDFVQQNLAVGPSLRAQAFFTDNTIAPMVLTVGFTRYDVTLATPGAAGINQTHNTLIGLTPGDAGHTDLVVISGRPGGQLIRGGTLVGDSLALQASSGGLGQIQLVSQVRLDTGNSIIPQTGGVSDLGSQTEYMRNLWCVGINLSPIGTPFTIGNDMELPVIPAHRFISIYAQGNGDATSFPGPGIYAFIEGKTAVSVNNGMDTDNAGRIINLGPDANFRVSFTATILPLQDDEVYSFLIYINGAPADGSYVAGYQRNQPYPLSAATHLMVFVPSGGHIQMGATSLSGNKYVVQDYAFSAEVLL